MTRMRRIIPSLATAALLIQGCAHQPPARVQYIPKPEAGATPWVRPDKDRAPLAKLDPDSLQDAEPRPEPLARYGNHTPYNVLGKRYYLMPTAKGYNEVGTGSWYGEKFQGQPTSSMEPYDLYTMTAAHKTLPLPTYVRVTNLENGRSAVVKVNDRGPFVDDRIIDLSYAAAVKLGYDTKGTARVKVEAITFPDTPMITKGETRARNTTQVAAARPYSAAPAVQDSSVIADDEKRIFLQAGAFSSQDAANQLQSQLLQMLDAPVSVARNEGSHFRVHIGPFHDEYTARQVLAQIRDSQLANPLLIRR